MDLLFASPFFVGSVGEAVAEAQASGRLLCVLLDQAGDESKSQWVHDAQLAERLRQETVCLHLVSLSASKRVCFGSLSILRQWDPTIRLISVPFTGQLLGFHVST
jgi:hypothetical protein